jgi:hypothetical protein
MKLSKRSTAIKNLSKIRNIEQRKMTPDKNEGSQLHKRAGLLVRNRRRNASFGSALSLTQQPSQTFENNNGRDFDPAARAQHNASLVVLGTMQQVKLPEQMLLQGRQDQHRMVPCEAKKANARQRMQRKWWAAERKTEFKGLQTTPDNRQDHAVYKSPERARLNNHSCPRVSKPKHSKERKLPHRTERSPANLEKVVMEEIQDYTCRQMLQSVVGGISDRSSRKVRIAVERYRTSSHPILFEFLCELLSSPELDDREYLALLWYLYGVKLSASQAEQTAVRCKCGGGMDKVMACQSFGKSKARHDALVNTICNAIERAGQATAVS